MKISANKLQLSQMSTVKKLFYFLMDTVKKRTKKCYQSVELSGGTKYKNKKNRLRVWGGGLPS